MNPNLSENPRESLNEFKLNTRNMKHIHLMVDSSETVSKELEECIAEIPVSLVGLHACGDLTPDLIKQFLKIKHIRNLVLVSCCYHKMKSNFPLSQKLKAAADETGFTLFSGHLLRLAAQEPVSRWLRMSPGEHEMHARNVVFRSILEIFSKQRGLELKKKRRKATKDDDVNSFYSYLSSLEAAYELSLEVEDKEILMEIYNSKLHLFNLVENLTGLQFILQNILENLVIADRVQFLQE
ncbi:methyltransferase-like protein 25 [Eurytemora carolleeae]|uniref:methyltransferase-like protein 25 n=1 Tax=Eurytemora carolleeae TaxID=1294199 RepID=UPI000C75C690|nr:methyltransferase-like protein 25 [Eurytemora carolleeae]|eukprot:XP_023346604.1 methyltransferase-like protein 25 [Eurytemora affinis]